MIKSILFYIPTGVNIIGILVALYFLIQDSIRYKGLKNRSLWWVTLGMCAWVALCFYRRTATSSPTGTVLAWIPATPLLLYGIFILVFIVIKPDMK